MRRVLALWAVTWLMACANSMDPPTSAHAGAVMRVTPGDGLVDEPFTVIVSGARPGAEVRIEARLLDEQSPPQSWTAVGEY